DLVEVLAPGGGDEVGRGPRLTKRHAAPRRRWAANRSLGANGPRLPRARGVRRRPRPPGSARARRAERTRLRPGGLRALPREAPAAGPPRPARLGEGNPGRGRAVP